MACPKISSFAMLIFSCYTFEKARRHEESIKNPSMQARFSSAPHSRELVVTVVVGWQREQTWYSDRTSALAVWRAKTSGADLGRIRSSALEYIVVCICRSSMYSDLVTDILFPNEGSMRGKLRPSWFVRIGQSADAYWYMVLACSLRLSYLHAKLIQHRSLPVNPTKIFWWRYSAWSWKILHYSEPG